MKKLFAIMLALMLVLTMGSALAEEGPDSRTSFTITKEYEETNPDAGEVPVETLAFTVTPVSVSDAEAGINVADYVPTVAASSTTGGVIDTITVTLPTYKSIGVYTYTISENAGNTAGVTYSTDAITLEVTVVRGTDGALLTYPVVKVGDNESKTTTITNTYSAGELQVKKEVTGNLGDTTKAFDVTVTFTKPDGKTVVGPISYVDDGETKTVTFADGAETATATITLMHDETVTFTNIPYGVTYTVTEEDYTKSDGYDAAEYDFSDSNKKIDTTDADTVKITNNKGTQIDTGITTDNLPYIVLMGIVVLAGVAMIAKRRMAHND